MKEFNLSSKLCDGFGNPHYHPLDVKEFIRLLKEEFQDGDDELYEDSEGINWCNWDLLNKKLDKLAGEELV